MSVFDGAFLRSLEMTVGLRESSDGNKLQWLCNLLLTVNIQQLILHYTTLCGQNRRSSIQVNTDRCPPAKRKSWMQTFTMTDQHVLYMNTPRIIIRLLKTEPEWLSHCWLLFLPPSKPVVLFGIDLPPKCCIPVKCESEFISLRNSTVRPGCNKAECITMLLLLMQVKLQVLFGVTCAAGMFHRYSSWASYIR